ncbi:zinc finger protein 709-like [Heterocephalus glaber]|uniref:Zinc finger protein 709-like n=1 Tax=Heterocephalus glaber TaxID=10181 RepID=A0AAX6SI59_HETGA|nr:zinc finger protein 709-like [Heterocephalus glaber]
MTPDTNVHMNLLGIKPGESLARRNPLIGHSSPTLPIIHNSGLQSYELHGFEQKLSFRHGKTSTDFQSFQKHAETNPEEKLYGYKQCAKSYSECTEGSNSEEKSFEYNQDVRPFSSPNYDKIQERNDSRVNTCTYIKLGESLNSHHDIQKHERAHTGVDFYVYKHSWKLLNNKTSFGSHERTHIMGKPYVCKQCGKAFSKQSHCQIHERTHTGEKHFVCKQCGKAFNTRSSYQIHERTHTGERPFVCKQCGKAFRRHDNCHSHERTHTGEKPFVCKQCGKAFRTQGNCKTHERTHTGERPFVCEQCGKAFRTLQVYQGHERTHTGQKPFLCKQCGKAFTKLSNCKRHEKTHTGEKPYICNQCGKAFRTQSHCKRHEKTHTRERPFVCKQCGKAFGTQSTCKTHERTHTGVKPYECKQCGKAFRTLQVWSSERLCCSPVAPQPAPEKAAGAGGRAPPGQGGSAVPSFWCGGGGPRCGTSTESGRPGRSAPPSPLHPALPPGGNLRQSGRSYSRGTVRGASPRQGSGVLQLLRGRSRDSERGLRAHLCKRHGPHSRPVQRAQAFSDVLSAAVPPSTRTLENNPQRAQMRQQQQKKGSIPFFVTFLTDLVMLDTMMKDCLDGNLVNLEKIQKEAKILQEMQLFPVAVRKYHFQCEENVEVWFHSREWLSENERVAGDVQLPDLQQSRNQPVDLKDYRESLE